MLGKFFNKVKQGLSKTRTAMAEKIQAIVGQGGRLDDETLDEIEATLIQADVGLETSSRIIDELRQQVRQSPDVRGTEAVMALLKDELAKSVEAQEPFDFSAPLTAKPYIILVVGVNGAGKTTTVGKLAKRYADAGLKVGVAACDTFRAGAVPQLEVWAGRAGVEIVRSQQGADPAAVAYDAMKAAQARDFDVLLVDTAGRLHNKVNLMEELRKIRRVIGRDDATAPHETLLVLDATTGQNTLVQAREFNQVTEISGLVLTKLDGTAKGGIVMALRRELDLPVKLIGVGEGLDDLQPFDADAFAAALFED
jgi:fused signal recognition particle receptor